MLGNQTISQTHPQHHTNPPNISPKFNPDLTRFAVKSTNVLLHDFPEPIEAIILIENEKIFDVILLHQADPHELTKIEQEWGIRDYGNLYIFPGLIDSNVHLHANFGTEWENVTYSTELAASGGVTTVIDNPVMTRPYISGDDYLKSLNQRIKIIKDNSKVDFGVFGILEARTEAQIAKMIEIGVLGLKCYLMNCFQGTVGHYAPITFPKLIQTIEEKYPGLLLIVHPEMATERELYQSSPCRKDPLEKRLDVNFQIKSLEFGGGAHKGSYVEDFAKKTENASEEEGEQTGLANSPSNLRGRIKENKEKADLEHLVTWEAATYAYNNDKGDSDASCSDDEFNYVENIHQERSKNEAVSKSPPKNLGDNQAHGLSKFNRLNSMPVQQQIPQFQQERIPSLKENQIIGSSLLDESLGEIQELKREDSYHHPRPDSSEEEKVVHKESSETEKSEDKETNNELNGKEEEHAKRIELFGRSRRRVEVEDEESEEENDKVEIRKSFGRTRASAYDSTDYEESFSRDEKIFPKQNQNRPRLFSNLSSSKDQRSTCDLSESFPKEKKELPDDPSEKDEEYRIAFHRTNRKFLSLAQDDDQFHTSISPTQTNQSVWEKNKTQGIFKAPMLKMNLSLDQNSLMLENSPRMNTKSLNASPMYSGRILTPASGLLIRRMSRNSSQCNGPHISTSSTLSSPINKLNLLSINQVQKNQSKDEKKYNQRYRIFLANRPQSWEENAVSTILNSVNPNSKTRIIIQNISLASSIDKILQKKEDHKSLADKLVADCAPAYVYFTDKMVKRGETKYKVSPPFHNKVNRQFLIDFLRFGSIDTLSSYHFYVPPRYKLIDDGNFRRAFGGLDSIGCSLQAAWTASFKYQERNNPKFKEEPTEKQKVVNQILRQLYLTMCANPAQRLGIDGRKGRIEKGRDADLVIWDPNVVDHQQLNPNHVFSGKELMGVVHRTYLRGHVIYDKEDSGQTSTSYSAEFIRT